MPVKMKLLAFLPPQITSALLGCTHLRGRWSSEAGFCGRQGFAMWMVWPDQIPGTPALLGFLLESFICSEITGLRGASSLFYSALAMFILYLLIKKQLVFNVDWSKKENSATFQIHQLLPVWLMFPYWMNMETGNDKWFGYYPES